MPVLEVPRSGYYEWLSSDKTSDEKAAEEILSYIHDFYNRQIRIGGLAQCINIDRGYLYSLFRRYLGVSPKEYLTKLPHGERR